MSVLVEIFIAVRAKLKIDCTVHCSAIVNLFIEKIILSLTFDFPSSNELQKPAKTYQLLHYATTPSHCCQLQTNRHGPITDELYIPEVCTPATCEPIACSSNTKTVCFALEVRRKVEFFWHISTTEKLWQTCFAILRTTRFVCR